VSAVRVLVSAASRHGATEEIAQEIGKVLRGALPGSTVDVIPLDQVGTVDGYDAVVLGSAVYMGRWLEPARTLAGSHAQALAGRAVWLFSSGPVGDPPKPDAEPVDVAELRRLTAARDHRVFPGRIDRHELGFAERAVVRAVRASEGDFRDWPAVREWAAEIAAIVSADANRPTT
jgi:menaquinone-dependent protoporphyrinogen oxidase